MIQRVIVLVGVMFFLFLSGNVVGETSPVVNIKSGLMVLGGTLLSALLAFPMRTIKDLIHSLHSLCGHEQTDYSALIRQMERLARVQRTHGVRALEEEGNRAGHVFLRKGVDLVVDGYDRYEIRNILEKEYELYFSYKESQVNILSTTAKLAPVFGFVGTIIGLIGVLNHMGEPAEIGKGMALALLTTFYGLLFSNFMFLPLAKKLSERIKSESTLLNIILEGVMDIAEQKNAKSISHRLNSYLNVNNLTRTEGSKPASPGARSILDPPGQRLMAGRENAQAR